MERPTVGVEEEFLVVDERGHLSYEGGDLAAADVDDGELQRELVSCQVEVTTPVCADATEVRERLAELRGEVAANAHAKGLRLVPSGTPVLAQSEQPEITRKSRYQRIAEWYGDLALTSNTCGCHVHVGMPDRATGIAVSNRVRAWLPVLLAMSANSPFQHGRDTAYHSWRYLLWNRWPTAGPPPVFDSLDHYDSSVDAMTRAGAMLDGNMVYWDIRLSDHQPTLEFRIADIMATADETALIAGLVRGLVSTALDEAGSSQDTPVPLEVLRANLWRAARTGLAGETLHPVSGALVPVWSQVADLVDHVRPALRADGDMDVVESGVAALRAAGGGATRQRDSWARRRRLVDVVDSLALPVGTAAGE
ncbi:MAG TPA: glutamate--cysteine ligase [Pseudonocardiaceae bacterium]|jgi:carboxylate-amine ligase|nr:glutamate--cysteine ligase [Pseudonocardiaceae bacterium]